MQASRQGQKMEERSSLQLTVTPSSPPFRFTIGWLADTASSAISPENEKNGNCVHRAWQLRRRKNPPTQSCLRQALPTLFYPVPLVVVWGGLEEDIVSDPSRDLQAAFYGVAGLQ